MFDKKRPIAFIAAAVFALGGIQFSGTVIAERSIAASAETYDVFSYKKVGGVAEITACNADGGEVVIPSEIDGIKVTSVGSDAFFQCDRITAVTIPDTVTSIGENAFADCAALKTVKLGDAVAEIGACAFSSCSSLNELVLPESVKTVGEAAFTDCTALTTITVPDTDIAIESEAFLGCTALKTVTLPADVKVGDYALGFTMGDDENAFYKPVKDFKIVCYTNSPAYVYAMENLLGCEVLDPETPADPVEPKSQDDISTDEEYFSAGDVNGDGSINVSDIALTAAHVKGIKGLDGDMLERADADGSGSVNVTDISMIAGYVKGLYAL